MKKIVCIFVIILALSCKAQDTIKVLFIGNSFTYVENMPDLFRNIADSAGYKVKIQMYAPGGVSVGDISQGTQAHMNNPLVYDNIRSDKWDYVVLQDNQGRFVLDYGQFSSTSLVIQGHQQIRDSVLKNNPCAKMVWFEGWGLKNGMPPYGNTGIEMIERIAANYHFMNDSLQQIIAPIGGAWKKLIITNPAIDPWSADETHQSLAGSFLTANVIYACIFRDNPGFSNANGGLTVNTSTILKQIAWETFTDSLPHINLQSITPVLLWQNNQLIAGNYPYYYWFKDMQWLSNNTSNVLNVNQNGHYFLIAKNTNGCLLKSISQHIFITSDDEMTKKPDFRIYPNPVEDFLNIPIENATEVFLYNANGSLITTFNGSANQVCRLNTTELKKGIYFLKFQVEKQNIIRKFIKK
jgi:hypothetical protein